MERDIRAACPEDLQRIIFLTACMANESPRYSALSFSIDKATQLIQTLTSQGGLFVAIKHEQVVGFIAGVVIEHFLSHDTFACDIGVFVLPECRGGSYFLRLVKTFEKWAKDKGAQEIQLGVSTGVHPEQTVRMYERLGYKMSSYGLIKAGV